MKRSTSRIALLLATAAIVPALTLCGCDRDQQVRAYTTPKETSTAEASAGPVGGVGQLPPGGLGMTENAPANDIRWTLPAGWREVPVAEDAGAFFRPDARIQVDANDPKLVLSVSHLGDAPGARSVVQNVNRWEGQEGLPPTSEADLAKVVKQVPIGDGSTADLVDFGGNGKRFLGAIIPHAQQTWFLKLPGSEAALSAHKGEFDAFVASIHFDQGSQSARAQQDSASTIPGNSNRVKLFFDKNGQLVTASPGNAPADAAYWQIPADWKIEPATMPLLTKFTAANGAVTIKVSSFAAGNFGGLADNLNRWRGEVDLPPIDAAHAEDVKPRTLGHATWKIYDFASPPIATAKNRVIVGQTESNGNVYFFKMIGPEQAVTQQQPAFEKFLESVGFGS